MDRLTHSAARPKHLEQNQRNVEVNAGSSKPTSASKNKTAQPTIRNIAEKNGKIIYPSIQPQENKKFITRHDDDSSIVESSSSSDEDDNGGFKKAASEITLSSRPSSTQKKNSVTAFEALPIHSFEQMPEDVIRKILFENVIDLNDIQTTAKNLLNFASISKFNREFVRQLLTEEGTHEVSFEITKSVIPKLLARLAGDDKAEFTQADVDSLVHEWPYLTVDCSYKENLFSARGLKAVNDILFHPGLQGARIINNLPANDVDWNQDHHAFNYNGLKLIHTLLSRKSSTPLKVDFIFKNWLPSFDSNYQINENCFDLIKKIQDSGDIYSGLTFGKFDLSRVRNIRTCSISAENDPISIQNMEYQFNYVKMMCNIALTHSACTIILAGLQLSDSELGLILDEIRLCDKSSLEYLQLAENDIYESAVESLSVLLQSKNTCLRFVEFGQGRISDDALNIFSLALENNHSLEGVYINLGTIPRYHPINYDLRVMIIGGHRRIN